MKRMIPSSKLTIKNDKLTAMEGIYDSEGNQIIADGGSLVAGNPEVPAGTSPTELTGISIQNDSTKQYFKITHELPAQTDKNLLFKKSSGASPQLSFAESGSDSNLSIYAGINPVSNQPEGVVEGQNIRFSTAGNPVEFEKIKSNNIEIPYDSNNENRLIFLTQNDSATIYGSDYEDENNPGVYIPYLTISVELDVENDLFVSGKFSLDTGEISDGNGNVISTTDLANLIAYAKSQGWIQ